MTVSAAQVKANMKFEKKAYDKILLRLRKDSDINGTVVKNHAESGGESTNSFIVRAIRETIARDKAGGGADG